MSAEMRTRARFPDVQAARGHYESFYVKASAPGGGESIWLRYTVLKRADSEPTASLWATHFSAADGPVASKASVEAKGLSVPEGGYIEIDGSRLGPGVVNGSIGGERPPASWDLHFDEGDAPLFHLPRRFLYRSRLPRTKSLSPHPNSRFSGSLEIGGRRVELDGWPGMVGHNWGTEHAERWIWMQAPALGGTSSDYLDAVAARVKVGPRVLPWVAAGRIVLDGQAYALGGLLNSYGTEFEETPTGAEFTLPGRGITVKGKISASKESFVGWLYGDPTGPDHNALNCSIADLEIKVERADERHARRKVEGSAVYELGTRDTDHGIELQPFPDE